MTLAYAEIPAPGTAPKPRSRRITMMADWGIPIGAQRDLLCMGGTYVDLAKIAVGLSRLLDRAYLMEKIARYRAHGIEAFPGGMFLEYAFYHGRSEEFLRETRELGYTLIEVSDNTVHFPGDAKYALIRRAIDGYGLTVLGETGSKHVTTDTATLIADIHRCLDAGSAKVFVEAADVFTGGEFRPDVITTLATEVPLDALIFELPGKWIRNIHQHQVHSLMVRLVEVLGPDANIANVFPEDILVLESLRQGLGVNVKLPPKDGADPEGQADRTPRPRSSTSAS